MANNEAIRTKLEEKYTHVTFVKTDKYGIQLWLVNDNMEKIYVDPDWPIDDLFPHVEIKKITRNHARMDSKKIEIFLDCMKQGKIATEAALYKKYTVNQLKALRKA